jgi:hypothetical protein
VDTIYQSKNQVANITELKSNISCSYTQLDSHIANLERWGLIDDEKPTGNGKARKITFRKSYTHCLSVLTKLKNAIDTVNVFF